jgi:protein-S-isoprenylcysteine O-methyltransferase Ste14
MNPAVVSEFVALAWATHAADWSLMTLQRRGRIAHHGEWTREIGLRLLMGGLVIWALLTPRHVESPAVILIGLTLVWVGTLFAIVGRRTLGSSWGIGIRPHGNVAASGVFAIVRHPIYLGTLTSLAGQWLALSNIGSLLLLLGAIVVIPFKVRREATFLPRLSDTKSR